MPDTSKHDPNGTDRDENYSVLTVKLTDIQKREVRMRAARENKSMSDYVRDVLFGEEEFAPAA